MECPVRSVFLREAQNSCMRQRIDSGPQTVVREVVLTRKWECDECRRVISKGSAARVHITAGQGRNRVYHVACDPKG